MAGLTREQRAEREAAKLAEQQQAKSNPEQQEQQEQQEEAIPGAEAGENEIEFVMMVRDQDKYPAPHTAQVHPDEVVNYHSGGWVEDK